MTTVDWRGLLLVLLVPACTTEPERTLPVFEVHALDEARGCITTTTMALPAEFASAYRFEDLLDASGCTNTTSPVYFEPYDTCIVGLVRCPDILALASTVDCERAADPPACCEVVGQTPDLRWCQD